jgi:hypothetical protein
VVPNFSWCLLTDTLSGTCLPNKITCSLPYCIAQGNTTMFRCAANFTIKENVQWEAVPIHIIMMNGNIINLDLDSTKTEDHFYGLPIFGTIQSIVD